MLFWVVLGDEYFPELLADDDLKQWQMAYDILYAKNAF